MSKNTKRADIISMILSKPNNTLTKTTLKNMKKEQLEKLLLTLGIAQPQESKLEEPPKKTFKKKERKLIEFSDDEKDEDITQPVEAPKVEMPKVELPPVEMPKVEMPKVEVPKVDLPPVEAPKVEPQQSLVPVPLKRETAQPKSKPVLIGNPSKKVEKVRKPNIDDIKEDVKDLIAEFSKLITVDIRDYKAEEITEDDLIDSHNALRQEVEDNIAIICSTVKRSQTFDDWVENLLDIIRAKVERVL